MLKSDLLQVVVAAALAAYAASSVAQVAASLKGVVDEEFGGARKQSAPVGLVVGVTQGTVTGSPNLSKLKALVPAQAAAGLVCFRATTFDSVYLASGSLRAQANAVGASSIDSPPFPKGSGNLARYANDEIAFGFVLSSNCDLLPEKRLTFVPATFLGPMNTVRVALNSRPANPVVASLRPKDGTPVETKCKALDTMSAKSFHYVCDFTLARTFPAGPTALEVTRKLPGARENTEIFNVILHNPARDIVD